MDGRARRGVNPRATYLFRLHFPSIFRYSHSAFPSKHRSKRPFSMLGSTGNDSISILSSFELVFVHLNVIHRPTASTQPKNVVASREMFMCGKTPSKRTIHNLCLSGFSCCMPNGKNSLLCRHSKLQTLHTSYIAYLHLTILLEGNKLYVNGTVTQRAHARRENVCGEDKTSSHISYKPI